jgi:hypothetical protein
MTGADTSRHQHPRVTLSRGTPLLVAALVPSEPSSDRGTCKYHSSSSKGVRACHQSQDIVFHASSVNL